MTIGAGIFLVVVGAILRFAVADSFEDIDLAMIGNILMIAGIVGALIGIFLELSRRRTRVVGGGPVVVERTEDPRTF